MLKSHYCGELRSEHAGQDVTLAGWVHRRRDHGGLIFLDLRDSTRARPGRRQPAERARRRTPSPATLRGEYVLQVTGEVHAAPRRAPRTTRCRRARSRSRASDVEVLNAAKTPPFYINEESTVDELLRLRYRYLDLRRERMHNNIVMRHRVVEFIRDFLTERGFIEIETPILANADAGGRARLPRAEPRQPGQLLRAAAVAAAVQAAADGGRLRALLPDRALLPRRGPARRPPAGVHAARPRDELRRAGGHPAA